MARVFISYRRGSSSPYAGRLYDRLGAEFGEDTVFMDVDTIPPGADFVEVIEEEVGGCDVFIALIGSEWLDARDDAGARRLEDPDDFVRLEVAAGLAREITLIPALVQGARMPRAQDLPEPLQPLARRNALELSDVGWRHDVAILVEVVGKVLAGAEPDRAIEESRMQARPPGPLAFAFVEEEPVAGRERRLRPGMTIGREHCDVLLDDIKVSRRHAAIREAGGRPVVEDLGSTNGTFVNERRIEGLEELTDGDVVRFGRTVWRLTGPAR